MLAQRRRHLADVDLLAQHGERREAAGGIADRGGDRRLEHRLRRGRDGAGPQAPAGALREAAAGAPEGADGRLQATRRGKPQARDVELLGALVVGVEVSLPGLELRQAPLQPAAASRDALGPLVRPRPPRPAGLVEPQGDLPATRWSPRSGAALRRSTTARRENGLPAGGARQSARRSSSRGPRSDRHAGTPPAGPRLSATATRSTSSPCGTTTAQSQTAAPLGHGRDDGATASRLSARSSGTEMTSSEPSPANEYPPASSDDTAAQCFWASQF